MSIEEKRSRYGYKKLGTAANLPGCKVQRVASRALGRLKPPRPAYPSYGARPVVLDQQPFRSAWRKFVTGVTVITTIENGGAVHGMAANGIASVSLDPLLVLISIGHERDSNPLIKSSGRFAINILSDRQEAAAKYYGAPSEKRKGDPGIEFAFTGNGSAVLPGCLAYMDCHVEGQHEAGDHTLFIAGVDELEVNPGRPLLFYEGGFHHIEKPSG